MREGPAVAVVGSGIAGLFCALRLAEGGLPVQVFTKRRTQDSSTNWAQGGIAAILDKTATEAIEAHVMDTLAAGAGTCDQTVVRTVVEEAGDRIRDLLNLGVNFQRDEHGNLHMVREGGHSTRRILHAKDATGREIERSLINAVNAHEGITVYSDTIVIDLIRRNHADPSAGVVGLWVQHEDEATVQTVQASSVVLATGGAGQLWAPTTNPPVSTGDGLAMAARFGALVKDMAFVQFHPTTIEHPSRTFLITEALRGEGAVLLDDEGLEAWRGSGSEDPAPFSFTLDASPKGSMGTRDLVARSIDANLKRSGRDAVWLVTEHLDHNELSDRFPTIQKMLGDLDLQLGVDPIPVRPAAHYTVGGVAVDEHGQAMSDSHQPLPGLYAIGEVASTGMHGANRLASNSLLEAVVYAQRTATHVLNTPARQVPENLPDWRADGLLPVEEHGPLAHDLASLRQTMGREVGIMRRNARLARARRRLTLLSDEVEQTWRRCRPTKDLVELRNMLQVATLVVEDASAQPVNIGLHYNADLIDSTRESAP
ncbi:MAG TPA: L-aspartate oxidase [Candidatus Poseidoniales archaeon]|nr:MAG TPA: L-aspartate oxidase [Candidatus Poseidoniales archaeon]